MENGLSCVPEGCFALFDIKTSTFMFSCSRSWKIRGCFCDWGVLAFWFCIFFSVFFLACPFPNFAFFFFFLGKIIQGSCWGNCYYNGECPWGGTLCCVNSGDSVCDSEQC